MFWIFDALNWRFEIDALKDKFQYYISCPLAS